MNRVTNERLSRRTHPERDLLPAALLAIVLALAIVCIGGVLAKAHASDTVSVRAYRTQVRRAEKWRRMARRERARRLRAEGGPWRTATASTYFEPQSIAGPGGAYKGPADRRYLVAHRSLPFGTRVPVRYRGRMCGGTVLDRGPFVAGRTWDLGYRVARALGFSGVGRVEWRVR